MLKFEEVEELVADAANALDMEDPEWFLNPSCSYFDVVPPASYFPISILEKRAIKKAWIREAGLRALAFLLVALRATGIGTDTSVSYLRNALASTLRWVSIAGSSTYVRFEDTPSELRSPCPLCGHTQGGRIQS